MNNILLLFHITTYFDLYSPVYKSISRKNNHSSFNYIINIITTYTTTTNKYYPSPKYIKMYV